MLEHFINRLVRELISEQIIGEESREEYTYVLITMIEKLITYASIIAIGYLKKITIPTLLFMFFFFTLRKRTGGYHAKNFSVCYTATIFTYICMTKMALKSMMHINMFFYLLIISVVLILRIGSINHPNMNMMKDEFEELRKSARFLVVLDGIIILFFYAMKINFMCTFYTASAVIICAILLVLAKITGQEAKS